MTDGTLKRFGPLSKAEITVVGLISNGTFDLVGSGPMPEAGDEDRRVRAELIRFLLLGGPDAPVMHEKGLRIGSAWITGTLDLEGCRIPRDIGLLDCRFDATPVLRSGVVDTLSFDGSHLPGFAADRLEARGDLLFRSSTVEGPISLRGGRIGGDLNFDGATLNHASDRALSAERISVRGSALFRGVTVRGALALPGSRIGGDLDLLGANIERPGGFAVEADSADVQGDVSLRMANIVGTVSLVTARVGGDVHLSGARISHAGETAVNLNRTTAKGAFFLREGAHIDGVLSLSGASLGAIVDDAACWPAPGNLNLNRCLYEAVLGAPVDANQRLDWLSRQDPVRWGEDFWPQPYEQLARVLGDMGHNSDKRRVRMEKERLQRRARRRRTPSRALRLFLLLQDTLVGLTTGYGRLPLLALIWIVMFWLMGAGYFTFLEAERALRPNSPVVLRSPEWVLCSVPIGQTVFLPSVAQDREGRAAPGESQLDCFYRQPEAGSYPKFSATMLSADGIFPGLGSGQKDFWSPDTRVTIGYIGKVFAYFQTLAGLALGLLAVAGFSGLVKSN